MATDCIFSPKTPSREPTLAQCRNRDGKTALHWAMPDSKKLRSDVEVESELSTSLALVPIFPQAGASIDARDKWGITPLHIAAQSEGAVSVVELLLRHGALINTRSSSSTESEANSGTPLHAALHEGDGVAPKTEMLELLLAHGADVDIQDLRGETVLHRACQHGQEAAVEVLLKHGANVDARNALGRTPLMFAAWGGSSRCMEILKEKHANAMLVDNDGRNISYHSFLWKKRVEIKMEEEKHRQSIISNRGRLPTQISKATKARKGTTAL